MSSDPWGPAPTGGHVLRWALAGGGGIFAIGLVALALLPTFAPWLAPLLGLEVGAATWCGRGICVERLERGGVVADHAVLGWDRRLHLTTVRVDAPSASTDLGGGDGFDPRSLLTAIEVDDLQVSGAPLPSLSGEVWPARDLEGEGVHVEGDTVHATLPTPLGELAIDASRQADDGLLAVTATCSLCTLPAPSADDLPLPLPTLTLRGTWNGETFDGTLRADDVVSHVDVTRADGIAHATIDLTTTPIASIYALVGAWVPEVARARIQGSVWGTARLRWDGSLHLDELSPQVSDFVVEGLVPEDLAGGTFRFVGKDPAGEPTTFTRGEGTREWLSLPQLGIWLPASVIAAEDASFREHPGYSLEGMREAASKNAEEGDIVRGGSTLTQQLAKNLFLDGTRSYARKLREILYAVEMERELGKSRILELYLNVVEFGPGIRGAGPATDLYFLKAPLGLLPEEAAWMASILRNPKTAFKRQYLADSVDDSRIDWILGNLRGVPDAQRQAASGRKVRLVPPP